MKQQTIIMIHGFRGTHHGLGLIAKELAGFDVHVPDLPGFGEGEHLKSYGLQSYVEWLHDYIKKLGVKDPILLGHSFGSIISAAYAAQYPKTISKLILVNPIGAPALEGPKAILTQLTVFYYWTGTNLPEKIAKPWLSLKIVIRIMSNIMTKSKDAKLRAYIYNQHLEHFSSFHTAASVSEGFKTSISHNVRDFAPNISVPTLLIAGAKDDITALAQQRELLRLFPQAELKVIKNVGHLTHYETPDQVANYIKSFVKNERLRTT